MAPRKLPIKNGAPTSKTSVMVLTIRPITCVRRVYASKEVLFCSSFMLLLLSQTKSETATAAAMPTSMLPAMEKLSTHA